MSPHETSSRVKMHYGNVLEIFMQDEHRLLHYPLFATGILPRKLVGEDASESSWLIGMLTAGGSVGGGRVCMKNSRRRQSALCGGVTVATVHGFNH